MKKLILVFLLVCAAVCAQFVQFTDSDYNTYTAIQDWTPAQLITLSVKAGTDVYMSNYISNWYGDIYDLGDSDYAAGYDMGKGKYGYVYAVKDSEGIARPVGEVHYAEGKTKVVTFSNPNGPQTKSTEGYLLGSFDKDAEIFIVMTPNGYTEEVDSFSPVNGGGFTSALASRQINTYDQTGQTRVNFGTVDGIGHEFVIGYEARPAEPSVQPLPGVLATCAIGAGVVAFIRRRRS